ncbi:Conserved_hypothetical protein [Hexamita inflata]|uniref:Uncharacterized protein n=1 Tax=Hexamita inflata TaxID=28002 RepID=A0AA86NAK5_9EUKA|nr:Conserved hypothetical protein [Hexamita inflata]
MFTHSQVSSFTEALKHVVESIIGRKILFNCDLFLAVQKLTKSQRTGIWKQVAALIGSSAAEVHDYYFNSWQTTFFQDPRDYTKELKMLLYQEISKSHNTKEAVARTIKAFQTQCPKNTCNERHVYQFVYRYALSKYSKSLSIISAPSSQLSTCNEEVTRIMFRVNNAE